MFFTASRHVSLPCVCVHVASVLSSGVNCLHLSEGEFYVRDLHPLEVPQNAEEMGQRRSELKEESDRLLEELKGPGRGKRGLPASGVQLAIQALYLGLDRIERDHQFAGDFPRRKASSQQTQDFVLARSERRE